MQTEEASHNDAGGPPKEEQDRYRHLPGNATASWVFGGLLLFTLIAIVFVIPEPSSAQRDIIRFLMATASALMSYFFVGGVVLQGKVYGQAVGAGGGFVLFVLIQFVVHPLALRTTVAEVAPSIARQDSTVAIAQATLRELGFYEGEVNGAADRATRAAIKDFQEAYGIEADGYVGPRTLEVLRAVGPGGESIEYTVDENGNVTFVTGWDEEKIVMVTVPQLRGIPGASREGAVPFYIGATADLRAAWSEVEQLGLLPLVQSWDGSFAPRQLRGTSRLSAHALGIAFDINARSNPSGRPPAATGQEGSVQELVPIFERHNFTWGGNFRRQDGNHFQWTGGARP